MNKKIITCLVIILLVVVGSILVVNNNSKKSDNTTDNVVTEKTNDTKENESSENSNSDITENSNENTNENIEAFTPSETASNNDEAVKKLLDFYLGEEDTFAPNMVKVTLNSNADSTITITKTDSDSNIYYAGVSPLSDTSSNGLIITIESYNDTDKTYSYSIKDISDVKSGNTSKTVDTGIIPQTGDVVSKQNAK